MSRYAPTNVFPFARRSPPLQPSSPPPPTYGAARCTTIAWTQQSEWQRWTMELSTGDQASAPITYPIGKYGSHPTLPKRPHTPPRTPRIEHTPSL